MVMQRPQVKPFKKRGRASAMFNEEQLDDKRLERQYDKMSLEWRVQSDHAGPHGL